MAMCPTATPPPAGPGTPFARALQEDSNLEQDWLWFSTQVADEAELRYCLARALYIDAHSAEARRELDRLARRRLAAPPARWPRRWASRTATRS